MPFRFVWFFLNKPVYHSLNIKRAPEWCLLRGNYSTHVATPIFGFNTSWDDSKLTDTQVIKTEKTESFVFTVGMRHAQSSPFSTCRPENKRRHCVTNLDTQSIDKFHPKRDPFAWYIPSFKLRFRAIKTYKMSSDSSSNDEPQVGGKFTSREFVWLVEKTKPIPRGRVWDSLNRDGRVKELSFQPNWSSGRMMELIGNNFPALKDHGSRWV